MLHLPLLSLDGSVEGNWPVWCVGSKRTIGNMSQKMCKEARKYTPVLIKDQRPYIAVSISMNWLLGQDTAFQKSSFVVSW